MSRDRTNQRRSSDAARAVARMDMHVHSNASSKPVVPALGRIGCPECYSPPERVYELARARGMTHVTITDHDSIDGALELAERGFEHIVVGEEVTVFFPEDRCKLHVLVWGLTPTQHEQLDTLGLRDDVYHFAAWLHDQNLVHALAHPLYVQNNRLTPWHIERCALLFKGFELLNGAHSGTHRDALDDFLDALTPGRVLELIEKHGFEPRWPRIWRKATTAGSDDHALLNVGRTWTEIRTPKPIDGEGFLGAVMAGRAAVDGQPGHSALLAHQLMSVGMHYYADQLHDGRTPTQRYLGSKVARYAGVDAPKPTKPHLVANAVAKKILHPKKKTNPIIEALRSELAPLLERYPDLESALHDPAGVDGPPMAQHERMAEFTDDLCESLARALASDTMQAAQELDRSGIARALIGYASLLAVQLPHVFSLFHQNKERELIRELRTTTPGADDMKLMLFTDTLGDVNGVSRFIQNVGAEAHREGKKLQIVTSTRFDLPDVPYITNCDPIFATKMPGYENLELVLPPLVRMLRVADRFQPDVIHISTPGSCGIVGLIAAKMLKVPICGVYHTDFPAYIDHLFEDGVYTRICTDYMRFFYKRFKTIFSRSTEYMDSLESLGLERSRMTRLSPGIDLSSFDADDRDLDYWNTHEEIRRDSVKVVYCGRISVEKNLPLLTETWPAIRSRAADAGKDAQLIIVGDGPYRAEMERVLAPHDAHFLGFRSGKELSTIYASCDLFAFPSLTDTLGQVVIESQSAGLPVIVADRGGPKEVVDDGVTGFVLPARPAEGWVDAAVKLIDDDELRKRMGRSAQTRSQRYTIAASFEHYWQVHAEALRDADDGHKPARRDRPRPTEPAASA